MSALLTPAIAAQAVRVARASFREAGRLGLLAGEHFHVVVMDPSAYPWSGRTFAGAILYEESFGPRDAWAHEYDRIARAKAEASWSSGGRPTDELQRLAPHLYRDGDVKWSGSVVYRGLIVAGSGVQPWFDAAFAGCVAHLCLALCVGEMETRVLPSDSHFLTEPTP